MPGLRESCRSDTVIRAPKAVRARLLSRRWTEALLDVGPLSTAVAWPWTGLLHNVLVELAVLRSLLLYSAGRTSLSAH